MESKPILMCLVIQIILLNPAYSHVLTADTIGDGETFQLTNQDLHQSSNNTEPIDLLSTVINQSVLGKREKESDNKTYDKIYNYSVTIPPNDDPADIYYPDQSDVKNGIDNFPFALLLQGANVDKSFYSEFARVVAGFGFIVVVPNHKSNMILTKGLYAEESEVNEVLAFMESENARANSPLFQKIDANTMVLLGHSYGGVASLYAIQGSCQFPFCIGFSYSRPDALKGGAFYGTNLKGPIGPIPSLDNRGLAVCLIQGSRDGLATPAETKETYNNIKDEPKAYITIQGANHYGITDVDNPPGAKPDENEPLISQQESIETIGIEAALFLRRFCL